MVGEVRLRTHGVWGFRVFRVLGVLGCLGFLGFLVFRVQTCWGSSSSYSEPSDGTLKYSTICSCPYWLVNSSLENIYKRPKP